MIADDQPMMRAGFRAVLEATGNIKIVAEAGNGEEAVAAATKHAPDVVLMDIRMPVMDGIEATRRLPRQRVLILTTFGLDEYIIDALRLVERHPIRSLATCTPVRQDAAQKWLTRARQRLRTTSGSAVQHAHSSRCGAPTPERPPAADANRGAGTSRSSTDG